MQDSNDGAGAWLRLTVEKAAGTGSVSLVQVQGTNSDWQSMSNYWGAAWEIGVSPAPPLNLRIVSSDGSEVGLDFLCQGQTFVWLSG